MRKLNISLLENINKNYDYNYNKETLQSIYNELTLTESVNINDIIEQFESV